MSKHKAIRILGIDPGSHLMGLGVIETQESRFIHIHHELIRAPKTADLGLRLVHIHKHLEAMLAQFRPDIVVVEQVFFGKNADSAFKLGHARGVALLGGQLSGAIVLEVSAREVKKILTGSGGASKEQVRDQVCRWLGLKIEQKEMDVSDALSLAIAGSFEYEKRLRLQKMERSMGGLL